MMYVIPFAINSVKYHTCIIKHLWFLNVDEFFSYFFRFSILISESLVLKDLKGFTSCVAKGWLFFNAVLAKGWLFKFHFTFH